MMPLLSCRMGRGRSGLRTTSATRCRSASPATTSRRSSCAARRKKAPHLLLRLGTRRGGTRQKKAETLYPGIEIVGTRNGFFSEKDEPAIIEEIRKAKPDLLLAALGVPKQEKWLYAHKDELGVPVSIGVGGTLDVMAGVMKRAPRWMQKAKLEWLFRGMLQPKRAGRLMALPKFVLKVHHAKK